MDIWISYFNDGTISHLRNYSIWAPEVLTYNLSYLGGRDQGDYGLKPAWAVCKILSRKHWTQKRAGGVTQVVECLPSKCEALNSTAKKKKKEEIILVNCWRQITSPSYRERYWEGKGDLAVEDSKMTQLEDLTAVMELED
jgi:hypothetical protein